MSSEQPQPTPQPRPHVNSIRIVGTFYRAEADKAVLQALWDAGKRQHIATLVPEPDNPHDPYAVRVHLKAGGTHIGYIPRSVSRAITDLLSARTILPLVTITAKKPFDLYLTTEANAEEGDHA